MKTNILIIGVGSAGVNVADKMNLPNSQKLFVDSDAYMLNHLKSEGEKILLECKYRSKCPSYHCGCIQNPAFCKEMVAEYEDEIKECIQNAFEELDA